MSEVVDIDIRAQKAAKICLRVASEMGQLLPPVTRHPPDPFAIQPPEHEDLPGICHTYKNIARIANTVQVTN